MNVIVPNPIVYSLLLSFLCPLGHPIQLPSTENVVTTSQHLHSIVQHYSERKHICEDECKDRITAVTNQPQILAVTIIKVNVPLTQYILVQVAFLRGLFSSH